MGDDCFGIGRRWRLDSDFTVKPTRAAQGIRQLTNLVCRGDHKYSRFLYIIDPCLHSHIFRCVTAGAILIGKFVHVVKKEDSGSFFLCFCKRLRDAIDKGVAAFVPSHRNRVQSAFFHEAICQKALAQAGVAIQQQSVGQTSAHFLIDRPVADHIADLQQFPLDGFVPDHLVK